MQRHLRIVKGGSLSAGVQQPEMIKLYRPYSIGDLRVANTVYHDVRFNWYCLERDEPIGAFEELIANYQHLEAHTRPLMETEANRCLLADEVEDLRWYLRNRYGLHVIAEPVKLPIRERTHLLGENPNVVFDFLQLTENTGYSLLFKVWGYYTTLHCLTSPALESGVTYLMKALKWLRPGMATNEGELEKVVKRLYQEDGLYVAGASEELMSS